MVVKDFELDTNVILHDPNAHLSFQEHDVTIPIEVITELDNFKKGQETINFNAREFLRSLDEFPKNELFSTGVSLGKGLGKIKVDIGYSNHKQVKKIFPENIIDHRILNTAYVLANPRIKNSGRELILVSKDVNLRMKAASLKIKAEDYKTDMVSNISGLYENTLTISVDSTLIDLLYKKKAISLPFDEQKPYENEFVILKSNNQKKSALAIYKKNQIHLITKEPLSCYGIKPLNSEQAFAMTVLLDPEINLITILGKAGTGKTIVSLAVALHLMENNTFEEVLFTRETVSMGRDIGFLPGDANEKLNPYMQGMFDNLDEIKKSSLNFKKIDELRKDNKIKIEPLPYIRGRSLSNKFFIIDECQNLTPHEVKTIITRAGKGTKIVMIGDTSQIDVPLLDERSNGFSYLIDRFKGQHLYAHVVLRKGERSELSELASILL